MSDAAHGSLEAKIAILVAMRGMFESANFKSAVLTIANCPGKLVVTGMGKSGHIGRKIAATLNSTGQRAAFLHPAEAAHGDMGVIAAHDVILMLSNSGETDELRAIMDYCDGRNVVAIITAKPNAYLAMCADMIISTPDLPEGDTIGKAPMASTVAQLAVGDAMAAALMERRGFTVADFVAIHHGGYLGRSLSAVA